MTYYDDNGKDIVEGCVVSYVFDIYEFRGTIQNLNGVMCVVNADNHAITLESVVKNYDSIVIV